MSHEILEGDIDQIVEKTLAGYTGHGQNNKLTLVVDTHTNYVSYKVYSQNLAIANTPSLKTAIKIYNFL